MEKIKLDNKQEKDIVDIKCKWQREEDLTKRVLNFINKQKDEYCTKVRLHSAVQDKQVEH